MKSLFTIILTSLVYIARAQMVVPNIQEKSNTLKIVTNVGIGTCFIIVDSVHTYIITAKHMFPNAKNTQRVSFGIDTTTGQFQVTGTLLLILSTS